MQSGTNRYTRDRYNVYTQFRSKSRSINDYVNFTCLSGNWGYMESGHFSNRYFDTEALKEWPEVERTRKERWS